MSVTVGRQWVCDTCKETTFTEGYNVNSLGPVTLPKGWVKLDDDNECKHWKHFCSKECTVEYLKGVE